MLYVLVDYDNVDSFTRGKGAKYLCDKVISSLGSFLSPPVSEIRFRLYGGWFERTSYTSRANRLSKEIQAFFPFKYSPVPGASATNVRAELARSLLANPAKDLHFTFRDREYPEGISCKDPKDAGCTNTPCELKSLKFFFENNICPAKGCSVMADAIMSKPAQKMVDTMLVADMAFLSTVAVNKICVVSSDEDCWPGISMLVQRSKNVVHMHTMGMATTPDLIKGISSNYRQVNL